MNRKKGSIPKMRVTFILKGSLEALPPLLPRLIAFAKRGITTAIICSSMTENNQAKLSEFGVRCYHTKHSTKIFGKEKRLADWANFRANVKTLLDTELRSSELLYICSADAALCLGGLLKRKAFILQCNELYDTLPMYKHGLKRYMQNAAAVVVPELCRANLFAYWYSLEQLPLVIPNIPLTESLQRRQKINDPCAEKIMEEIGEKKILIYQGHITSGERSLNVVAEALNAINDPSFVLLLMGREHDNTVSALQNIYDKTYYIPFIPAPEHLQVTSHAYIGLLSYSRVSMNNMFCAPNKLYEYSSFGIPMLGNDIPGLKYSIEGNSMGCCADYNDLQAVISGIRMIDENHSVYANNALAFYNSADLEGLMDELLKRVLGGSE